MSGRTQRGFLDRHDAGRRLAERLAPLAIERPVVLALPRGGVPVAFEVASALHAQLDVLVVRKLGVPGRPEYGMGAVGEGGVCVLNDDVVQLVGVSDAEIAAVEQGELAEVERRARTYRRGRLMASVVDRTVIVVDDGIATGGTARAALRIVRAHGARRVILAVPVASNDAADALAGEADEIVALETPPDFGSVGSWYEDFTQVSDAVVIDLLARSPPQRLAER
jgi:putative phosphoribosyl transferase